MGLPVLFRSDRTSDPGQPGNRSVEEVGLLAHDPMLYRSLSVRENLAHQSRLLGVDRARSEELIEAVGLAERADEPLRGLSRGMVQRASAARSLLADPPLMLLDEPYANLDPGGREQLEPLLESNRTVVITGHDPLDLLARSDLALGLRAGRQDFLLSADEVDDQRLAALYGASPPARPKVVPT